MRERTLPVPLELAPDSAFNDWRPPRTLRGSRSRAPVHHSAQSQAARLVPAIENASLVMEGGSELAAALAALPEERRALGLEGLTITQLFGATGLCEPVKIALQADLGGQRYDVQYRAEPFTWMTHPEPVLYALPEACTGALLSSGGALPSAVGNGCTLEDQAAHFPVGSACRACLTTDGDHARCVSENACKPERTVTVGRTVGGMTRYLDVLEAEVLGCAPDHLGRAVLLAKDLGESDAAPAPFDHDALTHICQWAWVPSEGRSLLYCVGASGPVEPAYADVLVGRVDHIRREGTTETALRDRTMMTSRVELKGRTFEAMPLFPNTLATVSLADQTIGGWSFHPNTLRPDRAQSVDPRDYLAPEWIGAIALKTTTRIDGVPISVFNRNLCREDQWRGPDAEGRSYCRPGFFTDEVQPPDVMRWAYDWSSFFVSLQPEVVEIFPWVTLAATGGMDPKIPGGHVPHVLGSPVLADPQWEACAWPETFLPDEMANVDTSFPGLYTFTSQTVRFGQAKPNRPELRVALATSWRRDFCFTPLP